MNNLIEIKTSENINAENRLLMKVNSLVIPFSSFSYFLTIGMKDDYGYYSGLAHLCEHIIIEQFKMSYPQLSENVFINAFVDKEYTCFYAVSLHEYFNELLESFFNVLSNPLDKITDTIIDEQKHIISDIENENILSDQLLLNILRLEQEAFNNEIRFLTIINEEFPSINQTHVDEFINHEYFSKKHYLFVSGEYVDTKILQTGLSSIHNRMKENTCSLLRKKNSKYEEKLTCNNNTICIVLERTYTILEYFSLNILCLFYRILIKDELKKYNNFVQDISLKLYEGIVVVFFSYRTFYKETMFFLNNLTLDDHANLFSSIKRHFIYSYLRKFTDFLFVHKENFKFINYFNEDIDLKKVKEIIDDITFERIKKVHTDMITGKYVALEFI